MRLSGSVIVDSRHHLSRWRQHLSEPVEQFPGSENNLKKASWKSCHWLFTARGVPRALFAPAIPPRLETTHVFSREALRKEAAGLRAASRYHSLWIWQFKSGPLESATPEGVFTSIQDDCLHGKAAALMVCAATVEASCCSCCEDACKEVWKE